MTSFQNVLRGIESSEEVLYPLEIRHNYAIFHQKWSFFIEYSLKTTGEPIQSGSFCAAMAGSLQRQATAGALCRGCGRCPSNL